MSKQYCIISHRWAKGFYVEEVPEGEDPEKFWLQQSSVYCSIMFVSEDHAKTWKVYKKKGVGAITKILQHQETYLPKPKDSTKSNNEKDEIKKSDTDAPSTTTTTTTTISHVIKDSSKMMGDWIVLEKLGEGGFSKVRMGQHKTTGQKVALKMIKKEYSYDNNNSQLRQVEKEISAMKKIKHRNVLQMIDSNPDIMFGKERVLLIVLELALGGELFEYISMTGAFEEIIARTYFHQLMEGVHTAHLMNICHRDLKPENLLMDKDFQLKIADFGFARTMTDAKLYTECGTASYMSPEIFNGSGYDGRLSDVWACGVILFIMYAGCPPYQNPTDFDWWWDKLMRGNFDLFWRAHTRNMSFSDDLRDLIARMLTADPKNRIKVADIMRHPWYLGETLAPSDLTKILSKRKEEMDRQNGRLKEQRRQEQLAEKSSIIVRDIGSPGPTREQAQSDELPSEGPRSIILKMNSEEKKIMESQENNDEGDKDHNITGPISFGGTIGNINLEDVTEKKEKAPVYNPTKIRYTKFDCSASPGEIFTELEEVLLALKVNYEKDGYTFTGKVPALNKGEVHFVASIYSLSGDPDVSIIECQRGKCDIGAYLNFYALLRNKMDRFALKVEDIGTTL